jgi:GDPmannose 4,6-dehydratase
MWGDLYQERRILVTGCSGFAGTYLVRKLLDYGATVYGIDRWKSSAAILRLHLPEDVQDRYYPLTGNIRDISSLASALDNSEAEVVFHLAAQSYVPESFANPVDTLSTNIQGTCNLLEAVRQKRYDSKIVFAGSSEEYGLVIYSEDQLERVREKYETIFPEPVALPELPILETNPLRPMSPYAVSKVAGDFLMRDYSHTFGLKTVVSRAFNHEGAGRGNFFVTSQITKQVIQLKNSETNQISIGNVEAFRDWSHVKDIVNGYLLLGIKGKNGEVYNQGSERTNSVLTYILLALEQAGMKPESLSTFEGKKSVDNPAETELTEHFSLSFETTVIDRMLLNGDLQFSIDDKGLLIQTAKGMVRVEFISERFRPSDVPILLASTKKIQKLGFTTKYSLRAIVDDQLNYYLDPARRNE